MFSTILSIIASLLSILIIYFKNKAQTEKTKREDLEKATTQQLEALKKSLAETAARLEARLKADEAEDAFLNKK